MSASPKATSVALASSSTTPENAQPNPDYGRRDVYPASHEPQVREHKKGLACWCEPIVTTERIYHRNVRP